MWKFFSKLLNNSLYLTVTLGLICMVLITGYLFWTDYQRRHNDDIVSRLEPDTGWVESKFPVYFIMGSAFGRINLNGSDLKFIFEANSPIHAFHFSPNGQYVLLLLQNELYLINTKTENVELVEYLGSLVKEGAAKGLIRNVAWSPHSDQFSYERCRWSAVSSQEQFFVYEISSKKKSAVPAPSEKIPFLIWDKQAENLYYYRTDTPLQKDKLKKIKIYKIPLESLKSEFFSEGNISSAVLSPKDFEKMGLHLYFPLTKNFLNQAGQYNLVWSGGNQKLSVGAKNFLYFDPGTGRKTKLFRMRKTHPVIHMRWIPGNRYVITTFRNLGILVLEPSTGKIGKLIDGQVFGWFQKE